MLFGNMLLEVLESDLRSCEAAQEVAKKAQKKIVRLQRDSTDAMTSAILVRCSTN